MENIPANPEMGGLYFKSIVSAFKNIKVNCKHSFFIYSLYNKSIAERNNHFNSGHFPSNDQVITLSITGALNAVLSDEHKKEICRYLYNHQVSINLDCGTYYCRPSARGIKIC